jgi:hypothetical protein
MFPFVRDLNSGDSTLMHTIVYIVGLIVVIGFILSLLGLV